VRHKRNRNHYIIKLDYKYRILEHSICLRKFEEGIESTKQQN